MFGWLRSARRSSIGLSVNKPSDLSTGFYRSLLIARFNRLTVPESSATVPVSRCRRRRRFSFSSWANNRSSRKAFRVSVLVLVSVSVSVSVWFAFVLL